MSNQKKQGGLIVQRKVIESYLKLPGTIGMAFAPEAPGQADNVDLKILRVFKDNGEYMGEVCQISNELKKGAEGPLAYPYFTVDSLKFQQCDQLERDNYLFGYFDGFDKLFGGRNDWDEIFIGGGMKTYPEGAFEKADWFTFTVSARKSIQERHLSNGQTLASVVNEEAPESQIIKVPPLEKFGKVKAFELADNISALSKLDKMHVKTIVMDSSGTVSGILFKEGLTLSLNGEMPIKSVELNESHTLRSLNLVAQAPSVLEGLELLPMGNMFPFADHSIGCPPQWPSDGDDSEPLVDDGQTGPSPTGYNNNIRNAIEKALSSN